MKKPYKGFWSVKWFNPYTSPPDGMPLLLAGPVIIEDWANNTNKKCPEDLSFLADQNPGYSICWEYEYIPGTKWSKEAKARNRVRLLRRRMEKKCPLFAEQLITQKVAEKPAYYKGENPIFNGVP